MLQFCAIFVVFPILLRVLSIVFTLFVQIAEAKCCSGKKKFFIGCGSRVYRRVAGSIDSRKDRHLKMQGRGTGLLNTDQAPDKATQSMVPEASLRPLTARPSGATAFLIVTFKICGYMCGCSRTFTARSHICEHICG